jgi:ribulose-5-phosphate 4-epimerase/fuculose-1-phosphate aldolase
LSDSRDALSPRRTVAQACRVLACTGLSEDLLGHVSRRTAADRLLMRCRGADEAGLIATVTADIRETDLDGTGELGGWRVPVEFPIHAEVLRARPDVDAVVHCHPPALLVAGIAGIELAAVFGAYHLPAARLALDGVPYYDRSVLIRTAALGREVAQALGAGPAVVLRGHGLVTVGSGGRAVQEAVVRALAVETLARINVAVAGAGGVRQPLSDEDAAELPDLGDALNVDSMWRHHLGRLAQAGLALP